MPAALRDKRLFFVNAAFKNADIGEISVFFSIIKPVADNKFIRNGKAAVSEINMRLPARGFVEQRGNAQ